MVKKLSASLPKSFTSHLPRGSKMQKPKKPRRRCPRLYKINEPCDWVYGDVEFSDQQGRVAYFYAADIPQLILRLQKLLDVQR